VTLTREAAAGDAPALAALHLAAFTPAQAWGTDTVALLLALPGAFGLWRERAGLVLARMAADEAEILTFGVVPEARRQGHGAALLREAVAAARKRGAGAMFLEVAAANGPALALYAREGFAEVGRRRRYYSDGTDALVLRRDLDGQPRQ
jgi:[ribosomal protein S18]-alanine N-acetyltransferase